MATNLAASALRVGPVEVASSEMENRLYLHLKIQMIVLVIRGKELETNICGLTIDNLVLVAATRKEDSHFIFLLIYTEEPVIQTKVTKTRLCLKIRISNVDA